jgi:hypothetical protein
MAVQQGYGKMAGANSLVFAYDTGDAVNSYKGEPTVNTLDGGANRADGIASVFQHGNHAGADSSQYVNEYYSAKRPHVLKVKTTNATGYGMINQRMTSAATVGTTYTYSFDYKQIQYGGTFIPPLNVYGDGYKVPDSNNYYTNLVTRIVDLEDGWKRFEATYEATYAGRNTFRTNMFAEGANFEILFDNFQIEQKSHATPFTNETRSATEGLIDLTGNESIDLSRVGFDSNANLDFDGTDDEIQIISSNWAQPGEDITVEAIIYREGYSENSGQYSSIINASNDATGIYSFSFYVSPTSNRLAGWLHSGTDSNSFDSGYVIELNTWYHVAFTLVNGDPHTVKTYVNGVERSSATMGQGVRFANITKTTIGAYADRNQYEWNGKIPVVKIYNRALSAAEVQANFNNYKTRFNIV